MKRTWKTAYSLLYALPVFFGRGALAQPAGAASPPVSGQSYNIVCLGSGKNVDSPNASLVSGMTLQQVFGHGGTDELWTAASLDGGYWLFTNFNSGDCLDVQGGATGQGAAVVQTPYTGAMSQQWSVTASGNGYLLVNRGSGLVLDVTGGSAAAGAALEQSPVSGGASQQWNFAAVTQAATVNVHVPSSGFTEPATVPLSATVYDSLAPIAQVGYSVGATAIGTATAGPYSVTWNGVANGSYAVIATVQDTAGNSFGATPAALSVSKSGPTVTIMPLGDSITRGYLDSGSGYRDELFLDARAAGLAFQLTGAAATNASAMLTDVGEQNHNGYGTFRIDDVRANLDGVRQPGNGADDDVGGDWLTGGNTTGPILNRPPAYPQVVLLLVGTNDVYQGYSAATLESRLTDLLTWLQVNRPTAQVYVGEITPFYNTYWLSVAQQYNHWIGANVPGQFGANFHVVNIYSLFVDANGTPKQSSSPDGIYLQDGIHPSHDGYLAMGDLWFSAIHSLLNPSLTTTTTLASSLNPSNAGQSVTFTATVTGSSPTGTVTFTDGGATTLGTVPLINGKATCTTSALSGGTHSLTASYGGDSVNGVSQSSALTQTVIPVNTTLAVNAVSGYPGQSVTLKATLKRTVGGAALSGASVTYSVDGTSVGTATTSSAGVASFLYVIPAGDAVGSSHPLTAAFAGDSSDNASSSSAALTVTKFNSTLGVPAVSGVPGQSVTLSATLKRSTGQALSGQTVSLFGGRHGGGKRHHQRQRRCRRALSDCGERRHHQLSRHREFWRR